MISGHLKSFDISMLNLLITPVFLILFILLTYMVFRGSKKNAYKKWSQLPLEDGDRS